MSGAVRRTTTRLLFGLTMLGLGLVGSVLLFGPAHRASASTAPGARRTGVHDVTVTFRAGKAGAEVLINWAPPTVEQQRGLSWTSVYFGTNPQPILVFPPETDVTVPDISPGTYRVGVELEYGPRSNYTGSARYRTSVTVPLHLPASASKPTGQGAVVASPAPSNRTFATRLIQDAGTGALLVAGLLGAALLAVTNGIVAVRRRGHRAR